MNNLKDIPAKLQDNSMIIVGFISKHRTVFVIFIMCFAILAAAMQTQIYLNPDRNEVRYTEIRSSVNPKKIDQNIVNKLAETEKDQNNSVDSNFVPNRNNPFAE